MNDHINSFLNDVKRLVDIEIQQALENNDSLIDGLYKSAIYSTTGGKRLRAVFTILVGKIFKVKQEILLKTAAAVELIHAASLIMDDLPYMDDSQLRRGKPANHVVFGQDVALCASIALLSKATELVLSDEKLDQDVKNDIVKILSSSYGFTGLAAGQFVDLKLKRKNVSFDVIEYINDKKTAALFDAAGKASAIIGKASKAQIDAIDTYSKNIGLAFQIVDDILDVEGNKDVVGKDVEHDKMNFVKLVGLENAKKKAKEYTETALNSLEIFGPKANELLEFTSFLIKRIN
jgi:geranylgeranyl diphosphate synthase type II